MRVTNILQNDFGQVRQIQGLRITRTRNAAVGDDCFPSLFPLKTMWSDWFYSPIYVLRAFSPLWPHLMIIFSLLIHMQNWRLLRQDHRKHIDFSRVERDIPLEKDIIQSQIFFISPSEAPPPVEHWLRFRHFFFWVGGSLLASHVTRFLHTYEINKSLSK